jgi:hypothetical protein
VSLRAANSLRDLTSLRGGTMRNFDFAIQHYSSTSQLHQHCRTSFRHLGYRACFQAFACTTFLRALSAATRFRLLNLQLANQMVL